jgi:hypothetical protein
MRTRTPLLLVVGLILAGCAPANVRPPQVASGSAPSAPTPIVTAAREVTVYRSPSCSCCHEWEAYMTAHGFTVRSVPMDDMAAVKRERGLPQAAWSCHTAVIDGYVVEGHVPIEAIETMLANRPAIDGIALPGMPAGSPGMAGQREGPLEVLAISDGVTSPFGTY